MIAFGRPTSLAARSFRVCSRRQSSVLARLLSSPLASYISISPEVKDALHRNAPIVSLESAITSHGLPLEQAISSARSLNTIVRAAGAVPAPIGLIDGIIKIGLNEKDTARLAEAGGLKWKVGKRDIAPALAKKVDGGTTVSATSFLSHLVGIETFVTGGIGGVHRGAQQTMDISSDLTELGRTPVAVVCAGAKSILDIGLTLEYLETLGVTVTTFGPTNDFPAFYARKSGFQSPSNVKTAKEAAQLIYLSSLLNTQTGTLIGVPIPEAYEEKSTNIQKAVEQAVEEADRNGIAKRGKEVTPWILAKVKELTGGESVESNIALIENNARVGAAIAVELAKMKQQPASEAMIPPVVYKASSIVGEALETLSTSEIPVEPASPSSSLVIVGAAAVDIVSRPSSNNALTTAPGSIDFTLGGVSRNVHEAAFRLGVEDALLVSPVGDALDPLASVLESGLARLGARSDGLIKMEGKTPCVAMMLTENGDLALGVAQTDLVEQLTGDQITDKIAAVRPRLVCFDGNLSQLSISTTMNYCRREGIDTVFEPTSDIKALRWLDSLPWSDWPVLSHIAPNIHELRALQARLMSVPLSDSTEYGEAVLGWQTDERFRQDTQRKLPEWIRSEGVLQSALRLVPLVKTLWIKAGSRGLLVVHQCKREDLPAFEKETKQGKPVVTASGPLGGLVIRYFEALRLEETASVVGGGDSLLGALLAGMIKGLSPSVPTELEQLAHLGQSSSHSIGDLEQLRSLLEK